MFINIQSSKYKLVLPAAEHEKEYDEMMNEWESDLENGWFAPDLLKRCNSQNKRNQSYSKWLKNIEKERRAGNFLYFFFAYDMLIGAVRINKCEMTDIKGNIGYGIRPLYRKKGFGTVLLALALDKARNMSINPIFVSCEKKNTGSDKVIINNCGELIDEVVDKTTGNIINIYRFKY